MALAGDGSDGTAAVWGIFDLDNFGDQLCARITGDEIVRRLPGWLVRTYSPFGWEHPSRMDGGYVAEPLGERDERRVADLADAADLTLVTGRIGGAELAGAYGVEQSAAAARTSWFTGGFGEIRHPLLWNAVSVPQSVLPDPDVLSALRYVSVRDSASEQRLRDAGLDKDIAVVPDLGVLAHRLVRAEVLRPRLDYFRLMGWYPHTRPALVVQGDRSAVPHVKEIAKVLRWALAEVVVADIVLLEAGPSDGEFADLLAEQLDPKRTFRLPPALPPEDVLAAVYGSIGAVATDFHTAVSSAVLARRWVMLDLPGTSKSAISVLDEPEHYASSAGDLAEAVRTAFTKQPDFQPYQQLRASADKHFDVIAEEADRAWTASGGSAEHRWAAVRRENEQLREAYRAARRRLTEERRRLLERIELATGGAAFTSEEVSRLMADQAELERLRQTKLVRWSAPVRRIYGRLR